MHIPIDQHRFCTFLYLGFEKNIKSTVLSLRRVSTQIPHTTHAIHTDHTHLIHTQVAPI